MTTSRANNHAQGRGRAKGYCRNAQRATCLAVVLARVAGRVRTLNRYAKRSGSPSKLPAPFPLWLIVKLSVVIPAPVPSLTALIGDDEGSSRRHIRPHQRAAVADRAAPSGLTASVTSRRWPAPGSVDRCRVCDGAGRIGMRASRPTMRRSRRGSKARRSAAAAATMADEADVPVTVWSRRPAWSVTIPVPGAPRNAAAP